jgi:hypothetical protein
MLRTTTTYEEAKLLFEQMTRETDSQIEQEVEEFDVDTTTNPFEYKITRIMLQCSGADEELKKEVDKFFNGVPKDVYENIVTQAVKNTTNLQDSIEVAEQLLKKEKRFRTDFLAQIPYACEETVFCFLRSDPALEEIENDTLYNFADFYLSTKVQHVVHMLPGILQQHILPKLIQASSVVHQKPANVNESIHSNLFCEDR